MFYSYWGRDKEVTRAYERVAIPSTPMGRKGKASNLVCIENKPIGADGATTRTWQK